MNRQCKIIFNRTLGIWQVVSELAKARSKSGRSAGSARSLAAAVSASALLMAGAPAQAADYTVADGAAFNGPPAIASLVDGDSVTLEGNASLTTSLATSGTVTITGVPGTGSVLTLTNGSTYLRANLWHGFDEAQTTLFRNAAATTPIMTQSGYDSGEFGAGFSYSLTNQFSLYGEVDHLFSLDDDGESEVRGTSGSIGFRYYW